MAMGWDDAIMLLMAAASTASALNQPESNFQQSGPTAGSQPSFGTPPFAPPPAQPAASSIQPIQTDPLQGIASALASMGPPPQASPPPSQPTTSGKKQEMGPPAPSEDPVVQAKKNEEATKNIWAALPQAIAMAAPLLGMGQTDKRLQAAPVAGSGGGNQTVFQSPVRRPTLGELLNSLPRLQ